MRATSALLALALGACASAPVISEPPAGLRGCWIERRDSHTLTMRWFPDAQGQGWRGDMLNYRDRGDTIHTLFRVTPTDGDEGGPGWAICQIDDGLGHGPPCMPIFFRAGHVDGEGGWMELHAEPERLRLHLRIDRSTLRLFDGARDGCD